MRLTISQSNINKIAKTYIYITEDIFNLGSFEYIDRKIGPRAKGLNDDDLIKLRALRVVFNVIKSLSVGHVDLLNLDEDIYVITSKTGVCNYRN